MEAEIRRNGGEGLTGKKQSIKEKRKKGGGSSVVFLKE